VDQYECSICGRSFDSPQGRGTHRASHSDEEIEQVLISELRRVAQKIGDTPTIDEMTQYAEIGPRTYQNYFDSWNDAKRAADLEIEHRQNISQQKIIDSITELAKKLGRSPKRREMDKQGNISSGPCGDTFGSWNKALQAAGYEPVYQTNISRQKLINELQRLAKNRGAPPKQMELMSSEAKFSFRPYIDEFGSWNEALQAAGLEVHSRSDIPEQELIDKLQRFAEELGDTPSCTEMDRKGPFSANAYTNEFGSWNEALQAANLELNGRQDIPQLELEHELQRLAEELGHPPERREMDEYGEFTSGPYKDTFGTWNDALRLIGLEPLNETDIPESELQAGLREFAEELGRTPSYTEMDRDGPYSGGTYVRMFGSWNAALLSVGIEINKQRNIPRAELKSKLKQLSEKLGRPPTQAEMNNQGSCSTGPYIREFGSWNEALQAAGLDIYQYRKIPRSKLQSAVQQLAKELGRAPTQIEMEKRGPYGHVAYINEFGSWARALDDSDLDSAGGVYFPDRLDHRVRSTYEEDIAEILLEEGIEYEYEPESSVIEYGDNRTYTPDFVTNQYVIEVKGYARLADKEDHTGPDEIDKAEATMERLTDKQYVVIQASGPKLPADEYIQWEDRHELRELF
jgi:hypothetical protein